MEADPDITVFHAGTRLKDGDLQTAGGRVLNVCALGDDLEAARDKANAACERIQFEGAFWRKDIGFRVLERRHVGTKGGGWENGLMEG